MARPRIDEDRGLGDADRAKRPVRTPFGGMHYKLEIRNKDPNYVYYWQKDVGDNLQRMLDAGYEFVSRIDHHGAGSEELTNRDINGRNQSLSDQMRVHGGVGEYGREYQLVAMRIRKELWDQDRAADAAAADAIDEAVRRQEFEGENIARKYGSVRVG